MTLSFMELWHKSISREDTRWWTFNPAMQQYNIQIGMSSFIVSSELLYQQNGLVTFGEYEAAIIGYDALSLIGKDLSE